MQVRFLELLEGLPEEVQSALLENAYKTACLHRDSTLAVKYLDGPNLVIETDKYDFTTMTKRRERFSLVYDNELLAWRNAWDRIDKEFNAAVKEVTDRLERKSR